MNDEAPVDVREIVRLAHRRLGRLVATTFLAGLAVSALLGLGGEGARRALHPDDGKNRDGTTTITVEPPTPGPPSLTAKATGPRTVRLSWTEPPGEPTRYVVYRDDDDHRTVADRIFVDTGLVPGRSYTYAVAARNALGKQSPKSTAITVKLPPVDPPTDLAARVTPGLVALTWAPSADDGVVAYLVSRNGSQVARVEAGTRAYRDDAVEQLRTYEYEVRAVDGAGHRSAPASISAIAADDEAPTTPQQVDVFVRQGTTTVRWRASTDNVGVTAYEIRREGQRIATVDGDTTTYDDPGSHFDQDYTVVAVDAAGNRSAPSAPDRERQIG